VDQFTKSYIENHLDTTSSVSGGDNFSMTQWWNETIKDQPWNAIGEVVVGNEFTSQSNSKNRER
jgi:hypothetical protein